MLPDRAMGPRAGFFALLLGGACAQLQVTVEPRVAARLGSQALLSCMFSVGGGPVSTDFLAVSWYFQGKELASFDQSLSTAREGASMDEAQLVKGNASLALRNVTVQDQGTYQCVVIHTPERAAQSLELAVLASPVVQVRAPTFVQGKAQVLTCDVRGFYPEAIAVHWLVDGVRTGDPQVGLNGTFSLESFYRFEPTAGSEGTEISCEVQHETLSQPLVHSVRVQLERERTQVSTDVLVVVLLSALAVGGVVGGVVWALRESLRPFLASEVMGPKVWVAGESVALACVASKSRAGMWARWSRCQNGDETVVCGDKPAGCRGEAQPLMAPRALYTVQEVPLPWGGLATMLTFQARIPEDEGAGYRCSFISKDGRMLGSREFTGFTLHPPRTRC